MACILTKRKLLGFLMVLCLLSAVCAAPVSASKLTILDKGKVTEVTNNSGSYTMSNGVKITYETNGLLSGWGLGETHVTLSVQDDKAKDKDKK